MTSELDEFLIHFGTQWCIVASGAQGMAADFMWFCVEGHVVLQLDHDNASWKGKCDVFAMHKLGLVVTVVAAQGSIGFTNTFVVCPVISSNHKEKKRRTKGWTQPKEMNCCLSLEWCGRVVKLWWRMTLTQSHCAISLIHTGYYDTPSWYCV